MKCWTLFSFGSSFRKASFSSLRSVSSSYPTSTENYRRSKPCWTWSSSTRSTSPFAILTNIFGQLPYLLHFAGIRLNSYLAHLFIAIFRCCFTSLCNWTQTALIVKSILLFKSQWLDGLVDQEVLGCIRLGVMVLTLVMFVIDLIPFVQTENRMNHGLALMTGEEHTW